MSQQLKNISENEIESSLQFYDFDNIHVNDEYYKKKYITVTGIHILKTTFEYYDYDSKKIIYAHYKYKNFICYQKYQDYDLTY